jgi:primosomal protein N' (replication factor Y)
MHYYEVAPDRIVRLGSETLTYQHESILEIGSIVSIPVGKKVCRGVIFDKTEKPEYETKNILAVQNDKPLPIQILKISTWMSEYYQTPLSGIIKMVLPKNLEIKRRIKTNQVSNSPVRKRTNIVFNDQQITAINEIDRLESGSTILQGITGSGKTEVYFELIRKCLDSGKSALLLIPEISLTPQIIADASLKFPDIVVFHSGITESERHQNWKKIIESAEPLLIIGARSALFAPLKDIGLIILDESHDPSYNQDNTPRYSSIRVASVLGSLHNSKVVFGSATPLISERYFAEQNRRPIIFINSKAISDTKKSKITVVDMKLNSNHQRHKYLSDSLIDSLAKTLSSGGQAIIYHNRRGSQGITLCEKCGWQAMCDRCHIPIVLHTDDYFLQCKICQSRSVIPKSCPSCGSASIMHKAIGTKQIENDLKSLFPDARIARFDGDNSKKDNLSSKYQDLYDGNIDIAIGTQILAKGLDLPNLSIVGIIQAENGLALPDFASSERVFQLLYQVSGRVGRNSNESEVIVQTYLPEHPSVFYAVNQNYEEFYKYSIKERELGKFPPFVFLLKATCVYKTEKGAINAAKNLMSELRAAQIKGIDIQGPFPSFYEKIRDTYRWQIIVKAKDRKKLQEISKLIPPTKWQIDFDSTSLL